jgi:hypothetical protein
MNTEEIIKANKTARSKGIVGKTALVPRVVLETVSKDKVILDYGCGPNMVQSDMLKSNGFEHIDSYDFGMNLREDMRYSVLENYYDIIFCSNVFNTHSSEKMSEESITDIKSRLKKDGLLILNLPYSPRFFWTIPTFNAFINKHFGEENVTVNKKKFLYTITNKK